MRPRSSLRSFAAALALTVSLAGAGVPAGARSPSPSGSAAPSSGPTAIPGTGPAVPAEPPAVLPALAIPGEADLAADAALTPPTNPEAADLSAMDPATLETGLIAAVEALPPARWTIEGLAAAMAFDPEQPFRFVRDRIAFQPYGGVLRGAEGTLAARSGNSWDRALLLVALLEAMEVPARLAWGDLDATTAASLVARGLVAPPTDVSEDLLPVATGVRQDEIGERARRDHAVIRAALGDRLATLTGDETAQATAEVARHAWVQALIGPDWVDLDPSLPDAEPGTTLTPALATGTVPPDDQRQTVQVVVTAEQLDATTGALSTSTVLDQRLDAATTAPEIVTLSFVPARNQLGQTITGLFSGVDQWQPVLGVGDRQLLGQSMTVGGSGTDVFGEATEAPPLTGLWLTITSTGPGRDPVTTTTTILDRVPAAARAAGTVAETDLAPMATDETGPTVLSRITHLLVSTGGADASRHVEELGAAWAYVNDVLLDPELAERQQLSDLLRPLMVMDDRLVLGSELLSVPALRDDGRIGAFVAAPRLSTVTFGPAETPGQDLFRTDLVLDGVRLLADPSVAPADVAARRVWYGALQSAIEAQVVRDRTAGDVPSGVALSGATYDTAGPMTVLDAAAIAGRTDLPAALVADVAAGGLAIVAADAVAPQTWWAIGPDGMTRAMLAPSFGGGGGYTPGGGRYTGVRNLPRVPRGQSSGSGGVYDLSKPSRPARNVPVGNTCRGGSEYTTILGCVSVPGALVFRIALAAAIDAVIFAVIYGAFKAVEASAGN
jgi:hypothetical protein